MSKKSIFTLRNAPKTAKVKPGSKRDLIEHGEGRLTYVQIFGFLLILFGIVYFVWFLLPSGILELTKPITGGADASSESVAIGFFLVMLGVSFAFPDMLKGHSGDVSTMRIVVFMLVNVICMLLLKIGWEKKSLTDIGLDSNWVGIIAFLFGAKAAQAYFERVGGSDPQTSTNNANEAIVDKEMARLAVKQHSERLMRDFSNIESVSDTVENGKDVVALYVSDNEIADLPNELEVTLTSGKKTMVPTFIVPGTGGGIPHVGPTSEVSDSLSTDFFGSICCEIRSTAISGFRGVVTSGHIFTRGRYRDYGGFLGANERRDVLVNGNVSGKLHFQQMTFDQDLAIISLNSDAPFPVGVKSFAGQYHEVSDADLNSLATNVTIISRQGNKRDAYIIDHNVGFKIYYGENPRYMRKIILIGSSAKRLNSKTVSAGGDSGSCVFMKETNQLIGMLVGGNDKFTFVLPIAETLNAYDFKTI